MTVDKIVTIILSSGVVALTVWWFFGKRQMDETVAVVENGHQTVNITVDGGYRPRTVSLVSGVPAKLIFTRRDPSSCLEEVILPDFGQQAKLPLNEPLEINIKPDKTGEFQYSCGMRMFFGKLVVVNPERSRGIK